MTDLRPHRAVRLWKMEYFFKIPYKVSCVFEIRVDLCLIIKDMDYNNLLIMKRVYGLLKVLLKRFQVGESDGYA